MHIDGLQLRNARDEDGELIIERVQKHRQQERPRRYINEVQPEAHEHRHCALAGIEMDETKEKRASDDAEDDAVVADQTAAKKTTTPQLLADARPQADHQNRKA